MNIEEAIYPAVKSAIENYPGYITEWNKRVFYVEDFDLDIPSGTKHKGHCPFVAFRGGMSDSFTQEVGDLFVGTVEFELMLCIELPLVKSESDWQKMQQFTGEIERAIDSINTLGFKMKPATSKDNPRSRKGMITRVLTTTIDASECRAVQTTAESFPYTFPLTLS